MLDYDDDCSAYVFIVVLCQSNYTHLVATGIFLVSLTYKNLCASSWFQSWEYGFDHCG